MRAGFVLCATIRTPTPVNGAEFRQKARDLERELRRTEKLLKEEREKVEILKKSLHIFMQPQG